MIHVTLTNNILKRISQIDKNKFSMGNVHIPSITANKLRKNSKKKSSYASNKIEGNPLTEGQADAAIESDPHRHFLKPEQEVRNYFMALCLLEKKVKDKVPFSKELILEIQALVEKGASKEKIGLRGAMPPGFLFAVYDSETGNADYIPPEYIDIPELGQLCEYNRRSSADRCYSCPLSTGDDPSVRRRKRKNGKTDVRVYIRPEWIWVLWDRFFRRVFCI